MHAFVLWGDKHDFEDSESWFDIDDISKDIQHLTTVEQMDSTILLKNHNLWYDEDAEEMVPYFKEGDVVKDGNGNIGIYKCPCFKEKQVEQKEDCGKASLYCLLFSYGTFKTSDALILSCDYSNLKGVGYNEERSKFVRFLVKETKGWYIEEFLRLHPNLASVVEGRVQKEVNGCSDFYDGEIVSIGNAVGIYHCTTNKRVRNIQLYCRLDKDGHFYDFDLGKLYVYASDVKEATIDEQQKLMSFIKEHAMEWYFDFLANFKGTGFFSIAKSLIQDQKAGDVNAVVDNAFKYVSANSGSVAKFHTSCGDITIPCMQTVLSEDVGINIPMFAPKGTFIKRKSDNSVVYFISKGDSCIDTDGKQQFVKTFASYFVRTGEMFYNKDIPVKNVGESLDRCTDEEIEKFKEALKIDNKQYSESLGIIPYFMEGELVVTEAGDIGILKCTEERATGAEYGYVCCVYCLLLHSNSFDKGMLPIVLYPHGVESANEEQHERFVNYIIQHSDIKEWYGKFLSEHPSITNELTRNLGVDCHLTYSKEAADEILKAQIHKPIFARDDAFEYNAVLFDHNAKHQYDRLTKLGNDGWELVTIYHDTMLFKRRRNYEQDK